MKKLFRTSVALTLSAIMTVSAIGVMAAGEASKFFVDVNQNSYAWAVSYVDYLASNNIASGVGGNRFAPGANIERGDFIVFLSKIFSFPDSDSFVFEFKDVPEDSYYHDAIINARGAGVISEQNMFYPETAIKRIDAFTMLYRALANGGYVKNNGTTDISMYSDAASVTSIEQQAAAGTLTKMGIVQGSDNKLDPEATMTRAEMAVIITKSAQCVETVKAEASKPVEKTEEEVKREEEKQQQEEEKTKAEETKDYNGEIVSEPIAVENGGTVSVTDSNVSIKDKDAITSAGKSNVNIDNSTVSSVSSTAVNANNGNVTIKKSTIKGKDGYAVSASDGADVEIDDSKLSSEGIRNTVNVKNAKLEITDSELKAGKERSVFSLAEGANVKIKNSEITADCASAAGAYEGIFSIVSDADAEEAITIDFEDVVLNNSRGALLYARESDITINFNGRNTINAAKLIYSPYILRKAQKKGNKITINTEKNQIFDNMSIEVDEMTSVELNLADGCSYTGSINSSGASNDVDLNISADATLTLLGDMNFDSFVDEDFDLNNINDNGCNIYYNVGNRDNDYLFGKEYELPYGGRLIPVDY